MTIASGKSWAGVCLLNEWCEKHNRNHSGTVNRCWFSRWFYVARNCP